MRQVGVIDGHVTVLDRSDNVPIEVTLDWTTGLKRL